jgi:uncharacterized repeat protein (TIGR03803 family)
MKSMRFFLQLVTALVITFGLAVSAQAQTFTTLASFDNSQGGTPQYGALVQGADGNLYGTTEISGAQDNGTIFSITPAGKITVLYSFCAKTNCADGEQPWSGLILGTNGNFYGTTYFGGAAAPVGGTVFRVTTRGKLATLYSFCSLTNCADGSQPAGGLLETSNGTLYGTTSSGGSGSGGTVFALSQNGKLKTLYNFCSLAQCIDGTYPSSGLTRASNGTLYGTTYNGGFYFSSGTVFAISPAGKFKTLYNFCQKTNCTDGANPYAGLTLGADGNLYGTTNAGGANGFGSIYKITPSGRFTSLYSFTTSDEGYPVTAPVLANDGNLYGTTWNCCSNGAGSIYEITPSGAFSLLYIFCTPANCLNAPATPLGALMQATNGTFYGTTEAGGTNDLGTVYSFSTGLGPSVQTVPIQGPVGTHVTILGNGLTGATAVSFNGTAASFSVVSATEITATVPTGATTGTVSVVTPTVTLNSKPQFVVTK